MLKLDARCSHPLHDSAATRRIELAGSAALPPHTLMQRAGLAVARLALALSPHAQRIWIACGPGNNGGDGLAAAVHLQQWGKQPVLTWLGTPGQAPADAADAHARALQAGIAVADSPPAQWDLCIDALLGLGAARPAQERMAEWITRINAASAPVLAVDLPSGLNPDTGCASQPCVRASHTLSLLTLKPGLFTAHGRDQAGQVWFDDLGVDCGVEPARALLAAAPASAPRPHATHKGSYGDVAIVGGAPGMTGAALLAASAALHAGAGRVFVALLDNAAPTVDTRQPELMLRPLESLEVQAMTVVCGCGGGAAIRAPLARLLSTARHAVLDADALNALASDSQLQTLLRARAHRQRATVLTPHPLEAARLLGSTVEAVQQDRLGAAETLARRFDCTVVLKGSGSIVAAPPRPSVVNATGNARLATAGTGDVLAGLIGAALAAGQPAYEAACQAVYHHGRLADRWPATQPLTAGALARAVDFSG